MVQSFTNVLFDCTSAAFSRSAHPTNKAKAKNACFDNNCAEASNNFKQVRNQFLRNKSDTNRRNFVSMRTRYNKIKKIAKKKQKQKEGREVSALAKKQPKKFWITIKKKLKKKAQQSEKITITDLFDHFKSIYGEDENSTGQEDRDLHVNPEQVVNEELDAEISLTEIKNAVLLKKIIKVQVQTRFAQKYLKPLVILFHLFYSNCITDCF